MPVYWDVLWLWKPAITSWYTTISFKSRSEEGKSEVRSMSHFAPTWSPEEGRELSRTVMSKKWRDFVYCHFYHQWIDKSWCFSHSCVFSKETCLEMCVAVVMSLYELLCFILGHTFTPPLSFYSDCMYTLWWDMTGCSFLLRVSYTCHSELSHRNLIFRVWFKYQFNIVIFV